MSQPKAPSVEAIFDALAADYDQSGVSFFGPVGARLVALLDPRPGERALDVGCGRGAVTVPLAEAVGAQGSVTAIDLSGAMVRACRRRTESLPQVEVIHGDAARLPEGPSYDLATASLVLFFLADPLAAARAWLGRLVPDGRLGLTTFAGRDETTLALDALLSPYAPPALLDARTTGTRGPFADDESLAALLQEAGASQVSSVTEPITLRFDGVETWERFSRSTGQLAMWREVPDQDRAGLLTDAKQILDNAADGDATPLVWQMRYTSARP